MLDNYIQVFGWKVLIIFLVITLFGLFWGYKIFNIDLNKLSESEKLKQIGTAIGVIGFMVVFLYSLIVVAIYGKDVSNNMIGLLGLGLALTGISGGFYDLIYKKRINDKNYSQFGNMMLWGGGILFTFLILIYFKNY